MSRPTMPVPPDPETAGAFFGRRKGKKLRVHQSDLIETLLPHLALDLSKPIEPAALFPFPVSEVRLEIGFGGGEHLILEAQRNPGIGYIGCEPFINGMAKALASVEEHGLENIRLHMGDATDLIARLPDASLGRVDLLYPDPWPKRRQRKRRFVSDASVAKLARIIRPGGFFHFATDIDDYSAWTLMRVRRSPAFRWLAEKAEDWTKPWEGWESTRYEVKAIREGRSSAYLTFLRVLDPS